MKKMVIAVAVGLVVVGGMVTVSLLSQKEEVNGRVSLPVPENKKSSYQREADQAISQGDLLKAREIYRQAMQEVVDANELQAIREKLEEVSAKILFSPLIDECSRIYTVKPNDALSKIARQFNTTVGLLKRSNRLTSDMIKPGQELKVSTCVFSAVVDKSENTLWLLQDGEIIKRYVVSTGTDGGTPTGTYTIVNKLVDPTWYRTGAVIPPDSPENLLGTRWMGFDLKGYGIHGTTEPEKLGEQVTLGCVRMSNEEVEELYDILPVGSEVTIVE
jgi:LysM repeat protein